MFETRDGYAVPGTSSSALVPASMTFSLPTRVSFGSRRITPFASVSLAGRTFGRASAEAATGIQFPAEFCFLTKKHCPELAGVGVRAKKLLGLKNINVYAVGLYVEPHAAKKALHEYKGQSGDAIVNNQAAFDAVINNQSFEKTLRLVISFGALKRSQFVNALEERISPALKKLGEPDSTMKSFQQLFDGTSFKKGTEVAFAAGHKGELHTSIDGKEVGVIKSANLVKALYGVYIGSDPVSPDAKKDIGYGLAALLNEH